MIVKIKDDDKLPTENWIYSEGNTIIPFKSKSTRKNLTGIYSNDTIFVFDSHMNAGEGDVELDYLHLTVYKSNQVVQRFVTNRRTYLMNDNGKTLEKLI